MAHWAQQVRQRYATNPPFLRYDYGAACQTAWGLPRPCNRMHYGQDSPPAYELGAIQTPLALFSGARVWGTPRVAGL